MKRILQVTGSLRVGGLETVAMNCVRYSDKERYHFDFLVYGDKIEIYEQEAINLGCNVYHISSPQKGYLNFYKNVKKLIEVNGPYDIVHAHTFFNSGIIMRAAYKAKVPVRIVHSHSVGREQKKNITKKPYQNLMRRCFFMYATKYYACSKQAGDYLFTSEIFKEKGSIFPNTINVNKYKFSNLGREKIREEFNISQNQQVLGQVGHLSKEKNQEFLLRLFKEYRKNHDAILLLVGDGIEKEKLIDLAKTLEIYQYVRFAGTRSDIRDCLSAMDVFMCTSKHEGFGLVLLEAQANGLQCLIEKNTLVNEIRELGYCQEIEGFKIENWCREIETLIERRSYNRDLRFLLNSKYSDSFLSSFVEKMYGE